MEEYEKYQTIGANLGGVNMTSTEANLTRADQNSPKNSNRKLRNYTMKTKSSKTQNRQERMQAFLRHSNLVQE